MDFSPIWFSCFFCKRIFQHKSTLVVHMKEEHQEAIHKRKRRLNSEIQDEDSCHEFSLGESEGHLNVQKISSTRCETRDSVTFWTQNIPTEPICLSGDSSESNSDERSGQGPMEEVGLFSCKNCSMMFSNLATLVLHVKMCHAERSGVISVRQNIPAVNEQSQFEDSPVVTDKSHLVDPYLTSKGSERNVMVPDFQNFKESGQSSLMNRNGFNNLGCDMRSQQPKMWKSKRDKIFGCDLCGKSYSWKQSLAAHKRTFHASEMKPTEQIPWPEDEEEPISLTHEEAQVAVEVKIEEGDQLDIEEFVAVYCQSCNQNFLTFDRLIEHSKNCQVNQALKSYPWDESRGHREVHALTPPPCSLVNPYKFVCDPESFTPIDRRRILQERFTFRDHLSRPLADEFGCGRSFMVNSGVKGQRLKKRPMQPRIHKCTSCHKSFTSLNYLTRHQKLRHQKLHSKDAYLNKAELGFGSSGTHEGSSGRVKVDEPRPFSCTNCERSFSRRCSLVLHSQVHGKFYCDLCRMTFKYSAHLDEHMDKFHSSAPEVDPRDPFSKFSELFKLLRGPNRC